MIITRTPFRVSFAGGGSDMPSFYREHGGCVLSTSINKYMYFMIHPHFDETKTLLKYSENEYVSDLNNIKHSIFRCVLNRLKISGVEITTTADVPKGTGLGSSSSFTVGLIHTLACYRGKYISKAKMAEMTCDVEIKYLGNPIGKQDQYAAAFGGMNFIVFHPDDTVSVQPIIIKGKALRELQENLVMFYTGMTRDANVILAEQNKNAVKKDKSNNLIKMCGLAKSLKMSLENNDISDFGKILDEGWRLKREMANGISNDGIDELYDTAMKCGAEGGKLLGAGGGGFLLFYCPKEKQEYLKNKLRLRQFDFSFEHDGSTVIYIGDKYWD